MPRNLQCLCSPGTHFLLFFWHPSWVRARMCSLGIVDSKDSTFQGFKAYSRVLGPRTPVRSSSRERRRFFRREMFPLLLLLLSLIPPSNSLSGPHIADLNVLLPPRLTNPVEYRLKGSDGCFSWYGFEFMCMELIMHFLCRMLSGFFFLDGSRS